MSAHTPSKTRKKGANRSTPQPHDPSETPDTPRPLDVNGGEEKRPARRLVEPNPEVNTPPDRQPGPGDVPAKTGARKGAEMEFGSEENPASVRDRR